MSCEQRGHGNTVSGSKRVTVDQAAWRDAQAAAARLRAVNRELPGMVEALRRQQEAQRREQDARIEQAAAQARARQDALAQSLAGLSEQTSKMHARLARRLEDRTERLRREARDQSAQLREETRLALSEQEARLQADLAAEREERARDHQRLQEGLSELRQDRDRAGVIARALVADDRILYEALDADLPHEQFAPGRLAELRPRLLLAEESLASGLSEAAAAQAQELCLQLTALRTEIEFRAQDWQRARETALQEVARLRGEISSSASVQAIDQAGALLEGVSLDVNFWSGGELSELEGEVAEVTRRAEAAGDPPTTEELRAMTERDLPELDARLTAIIARAGARHIGSQVRVNLAELVVETLEGVTGYLWDGEGTYAGDDQRREFYAKLRHPDTSEIVVEIAPDESGEAYLLRVLSREAGEPDESERVKRVHDLTDSLRGLGLEVGSPVAEPGEPDPASFDLAALRRSAPSPQVALSGDAGRRGPPG
jgi:hypothetical protein